MITSLLIEERERTDRISMSGFWGRRARRLLPALAAMLLAVSVWAALVGTAEQQSQLRRDLPWSIFYLANWGQILGDVPYFAEGSPPLLRHLWSLAVEEQWYLVWPLAFVLLARSRWSALRLGALVAALSAAAMALTAWLGSGSSPVLGGPPALFDGVDRVNFAYLSTLTRASGLLLGAAAAFVWRPWRSTTPARVPARAFDLTTGVALGLLAGICSVAHVTERYVYQWLLPVVSLLSLVLVLVAVHPAAVGSRQLLSARPLVAIGRRSYGLYLWHWPVFVVLDATDGSVGRFALAMVVAAAFTEASYRFLEGPVRAGALGRWWSAVGTVRWAPIGGLAFLVVALSASYAAVRPFDPAVGGAQATFDLDSIGSTSTAAAPTTTAAASQPGASSTTAVTALPTTTVGSTAPPRLPRSVVVVGDSQAHSLAVNLPDGIERTFTITDGSLDGCSVYDEGRVRSRRDGFRNSFAICEGWQQEWADAAAGREVALVVLGAWDVFDVEVDGVLYEFGSPAADELFTSNLQSGIDAMVAEGAHVALLEVACMRPQDVEGAGVPALPERGDDARVAHVNELLRKVARANPGTVTFVEGPDEWCSDEAIATDLGYRWDGVHYYRPGAALVFETIAPALLAVPVTDG